MTNTRKVQILLNDPYFEIDIKDKSSMNHSIELLKAMQNECHPINHQIYSVKFRKNR